VTRISRFRIVTASLVILVVASGIIGEIRYGGICSVVVQQILAVCPLGFLERSLAARELLPQLWFALAMVVFSVILLGRIFCAWICPAGLVHRLFGSRSKPKSMQVAAPKKATWPSYSSYVFLGAVLLASFIFRFPVFCFFCPIGLVFGWLYALIRLFSPDSLRLELVLFPAMLALELFALKSWCRSLCPLGALLSILGNLNRVLVPAVSMDKCLTAKGVDCRVCERACSEGIKLTSAKNSYSPNSCTKCLECYVKCPAKAIEIALFR
jgi:ferredoxin-type protein NapH